MRVHKIKVNAKTGLLLVEYAPGLARVKLD